MSSFSPAEGITKPNTQTTEKNGPAAPIAEGSISQEITGSVKTAATQSPLDPQVTREDARSEEVKGQISATKPAIYSRYLKQAAAEDTELVRGWTETLNILLTFAGLQSAIVVAFILVVTPSLQPNPQDTSNQFLQQILYRLDNTTTVPADSNDNWSAPTIFVRILAWWYISFCCSLLSAFGALLSKQWVMHYQSQPPWANSDEKRAELREMRYQGLTTWWFFAVIESLPILLQLSLLFFALGLAEYLKPLSTPLAVIVAIFLGIGATFYVFTLASGTIYPFCPYKSPTSALWFRAVPTVAYFVLTCCIVATLTVATAFVWILQMRSKARRLALLARTLWENFRNLPLIHMLNEAFGESPKVGEKSAGAAGIFCWWLSGDDKTPEDHQLGIGGVAKTLIAFPATVLVDTFWRAGSFEFWTMKVQDDLKDAATPVTINTAASTRRSEALELADLLFHMMYYSPRADDIVRSVWRDGYDDYGLICNPIRKAWAGGSADRLPILTMKWPTIAIYLRYQIFDWCNRSSDKLEDGETRPNMAQILEELPLLLEDKRLLKRVSDVANVASLAAVALVEDTVPGVHRRQELMKRSVPIYERLFLALHRLSLYGPNDDPPSDLVQQGRTVVPMGQLLALIIKASRLSMPKTPSFSSEGLGKHPSLGDGQLCEAILRLLGIGTLHREPIASTSRPLKDSGQLGTGINGALVLETLGFLSALFHRLAPSAYSRGFSSLSSPEGLACLFLAYAPKAAIVSFNENSLHVLGCALGLRYHVPPSNSPSRTLPPVIKTSPQPHTPLSISILKDVPQFLPQLIHDVQEAKTFNSTYKQCLPLIVVIMARDLLFPPDLRGYGGLLEALAGYAEVLGHSGGITNGNADVETALYGFHRWDELLRALKDLDNLLTGRVHVRWPLDLPEACIMFRGSKAHSWI